MEGIKQLLLPITATITFIQRNFKATLLVLVLLAVFWPRHPQENPYNLESISLVGTIRDAEPIVKKLNAAGENKNIKGVLLVIDSPGGSVAPSVAISYAVKRLRAKKPVVVYANGLMASGAYYSGIWANKIVANPGSIIGSIGVIMEGYDFSGIMKKIGIAVQVVDAGKFKQIGTPDRKWLPYERAELNKVIQATYKMFVKDVATARGLKVQNAKEFANAHIFTASQAKQMGLVDQVGVMVDAQKDLIQLARVHHPVWKKEDRIERFMKKVFAQTSVALSTLFPQITLR
jgi:protease IV